MEYISIRIQLPCLGRVCPYDSIHHYCCSMERQEGHVAFLELFWSLFGFWAIYCFWRVGQISMRSVSKEKKTTQIYLFFYMEKNLKNMLLVTNLIF